MSLKAVQASLGLTRPLGVWFLDLSKSDGTSQGPTKTARVESQFRQSESANCTGAHSTPVTGLAVHRWRLVTLMASLSIVSELEDPYRTTRTTRTHPRLRDVPRPPPS